MEMYETEEQQIEAAKKWWKENGTSLIFGAIIGLSAVAGWKYYQNEESLHRTHASNLYNTIANGVIAESEMALSDKDMAKDETKKEMGNQIAEIGDALATSYADTPYAALASLMLAKVDYKKGNTDAAISKLSWVSNNAIDDETKQIAKTRLIRIYLDVGKLAEAETLINMSHPAEFDVMYEELKGDLYVAKNDKAKARIAYDNAILLSAGNASRWLQLKRQELGQDMSQLSNQISDQKLER